MIFLVIRTIMKNINWIYRFTTIVFVITGILSLFGLTLSKFTISIMAFNIAFNAFCEIKDDNK